LTTQSKIRLPLTFTLSSITSSLLAIHLFTISYLPVHHQQHNKNVNSMKVRVLFAAVSPVPPSCLPHNRLSTSVCGWMNKWAHHFMSIYFWKISFYDPLYSIIQVQKDCLKYSIIRGQASKKENDLEIIL
jgi:hypothetical protein